MRDNIVLARNFAKDLSFETFKSSQLHFYAVTRALEIVSEASRRLPEDVRDRNPHLPWRAIRDAGNFYRHSYDNVAQAFVWKTVNTDLPLLLEVIIREIERLDQSES